ncbi:heterokaryon incompatibility protein-domain-containing protein [Rostrohypoxylon terebratum]|nr:heterokaryon incompatibility protein-domain-containing protein [Rostrohypoxylon terebratum]
MHIPTLFSQVPSDLSILPAMEGACNVCRAIWSGLAETEVSNSIDLGSFDEALSSSCPIHTPLVQRFKDYCRQPDATVGKDMIASQDVGTVPRSKSHSASMYLSLSKLGAIWKLLLVNRTSVSNHPGNGRILDPDWADVDLLPRWKHECVTAHGTKCGNPLKIWPTRPAWLIDVERKCLVPGHECDGPYVAPVLDAAVLSTLQELNALDTPQMSPYVSPMVRHAMYVTSVLGERYLWADSLCITHHDRASATHQLQLMGAIYGNAVVTIIAADTDSEEGLPGLKGVSGSHKLEQEVVPFREEQLVVRNTDQFSMVSGTPYYNRGWTYQEYLNSGRKLLFNQKELHWECSCGVWHEETTFGVEVDKYINPRVHTILAGFPDLTSLNHTISRYNERELRYDEDALPAISGFLTITSRSFSGGLVYGLPEMFFDRALGWHPHWKHTNLRRRVESQRSTDIWAGYGEAMRINNRQTYIEETFPITEWYAAHSPTADTSERRRIRSTWFTDRETYKDFSKPPPPGWTRHSASTQTPFRGEPLLYPDGCGEFIFRHEKMADPDEEINLWYYPFPVADISESTPPVLVDQTAYLFCETQRTHLWARRTRSDDPFRGENILQLVDAQKTPVGLLHLDDGEGHTEQPLGRQVELVAIYRYKRYSKKWDEADRLYVAVETSENMAVLWIEWVDGVAYRLASGHVELEVWNKMPLQSISLVMGL